MTQLNITDLDFNTIKEALKQHFKDPSSPFTDYDFDGSALSTLLNVLAYNTHYNSYYFNMLVNEMFIDSAIKRSSIVSKAKELSYTPRSSTAATAIVDINVDTGLDSPSSVILSRGARFSSENGDYTFVTTESHIINRVDDSYDATGVELKEGTFITFAVEYDANTNPNSIFELSEPNIDTTTIDVKVFDSNVSTTATQWTKAESILSIDSLSKVYFIQENYTGNFAIQFGDGVLGKALTNGNVVQIEYLVTNKSAANGLRAFTLLDAISTYTVYTTTTSPAYGGAEKEQNESIRLNALKSWSRQKRAITTDDYDSIMSSLPEIESVKVWGGEDNDPPVYGKVFIALKPVSGFTISDSTKQSYIKNYLKTENVLTVIPEIVDPQYLFTNVDVTIKIDPYKLTMSQDSLKTVAISAITDWFDTELENFDKNFYYSRFIKMVDEIDASIISNTTHIKAQQRVTITPAVTSRITVNFRNSMGPGTISSTVFQLNTNGSLTDCVFLDTLTDTINNTGTIKVVKFSDNVTVSSDVGSINYSAGVIDLDPLLITNTYNASNTINFTMKTETSDIEATRDYLITLDNNTANVGKNQFAGLTVRIVT